MRWQVRPLPKAPDSPAHSGFHREGHEVDTIRREYPHGPVAAAHGITIWNGKVLLVRRAHDPGKGRWSVPGGAVNLGETVVAAARRELHEECGVEVQIEGVVDVADNIVLDERGRIRFHYVLIYLLARYVSGTVRPGSDAAETSWVPADELDSLDMSPLTRQAVLKTFRMV
jgi:8-oxo-dGTP diphosphatase